VLEEQRAPMTLHWHRPVAAVLDALGLDDVTLVGISLGGCLAIRAAALEPRVRRVVAFDVLSDFLGTMLAQTPPPVAALVRGALSVGARGLVDRGAMRLARERPVVEWGLAQGMHVFGCDRPADALATGKTMHTRDVSHRVRQDVLLMAGAGDHYVPLEQLWEQARLLSGARSITTRVFTRSEHAHEHCQVGNLPLAFRVISDWASSVSST
jgi:pimeloyl-ACP methyl ester carboxylesterase